MANKINENTEIGNTGVSLKDLMPVPLWTNPNPNQEFAAQDISLSSDNYLVLLIITRNSTDSSFYNSNFVTKGYRGTITNCQFATNEKAVRSTAFPNANDYRKFRIDTCTTWNGTATTNNQNTSCIPVAIYKLA